MPNIPKKVQTILYEIYLQTEDLLYGKDTKSLDEDQRSSDK